MARFARSTNEKSSPARPLRCRLKICRTSAALRVSAPRRAVPKSLQGGSASLVPLLPPAFSTWQATEVHAACTRKNDRPANPQIVGLFADNLRRGVQIMASSLDWSQCPAVESIPGKVSGAWVFRGTRVPVSAIFENLKTSPIEEVLEKLPRYARSGSDRA
jgi:uncharacterized protein (DUF433 family)